MNGKDNLPKKRGNNAVGFPVSDSFLEEGKNIKDYASKAVRERDMELGSYEFRTPKGNTKREERGMEMIDGFARYHGEWSVKDNTRDGSGIQVWADGSMYEG